MKKILIIGATSAIAEATARLWAARGDRLYLLARDQQRLEAIAADLKVRGAESVLLGTFDANDFEGHPDVLDKAVKELDGIDLVLVAHGTLPDQRLCEVEFATTHEAFKTNTLSVLSLLTHLGNRFQQQGHGCIAVISSVAGDRGRQSNYVYGSAKAAVTAFLQGLRHRLERHGVHVLTIKPGLVDTPMTADFPKGGPLWAQPETVAEGIVKAVDKRKRVVYLPWFWTLIMLIVRHLPEWLFVKTKL